MSYIGTLNEEDGIDHQDELNTYADLGEDWINGDNAFPYEGYM